MASDMKLKPGWLTRDVTRAVQRASEWETAEPKIRGKIAATQASEGTSSNSRKERTKSDRSE